MPRLGEHRSAMRHRTDFARDDRGDFACRQAFAHEVSGDARRMPPGQAEIVHVVCLIDRIAEQQAALGAQAQEIADREGADNLAGFVGDAEVTHLEPVHAADRQIGECVGRNDGKRAAHRLCNRQRERGRAVGGEHPQDVTLGDDAGVLGRPSWGTTNSDEIRLFVISASASTDRPCVR